MLKIIYVDQPGATTPAFTLQTDEVEKGVIFNAIHNESLLSGRSFALSGFTRTGTYPNQVTDFAFSLEPDILKTGVVGDIGFLSIFQPGSLIIGVLIKNYHHSDGAQPQLSGGTTPNGTDLFASRAINQLPVASTLEFAVTYIDINLPVGESPLSFYIHHAGAGDAWNGGQLDIKFIIQAP
jgi:hypothetical protein